MAYFILDKVAFFLKHYLGLSVSERDAAFRKVWYREGRRRNGLEPVVEGAQLAAAGSILTQQRSPRGRARVPGSAGTPGNRIPTRPPHISWAEGRPDTPSAALRWRGAEDTFKDLAHGLRRMHLPRHSVNRYFM